VEMFRFISGRVRTLKTLVGTDLYRTYVLN